MSRIFPRLSPEGRCMESLLAYEREQRLIVYVGEIFALDAFECSFPNVFWKVASKRASTYSAYGMMGGKDLSVTSWLQR